MKVFRIGHASLIVETAAVRCLMDPILFEPFECGSNRFEPPIKIDPSGIRDAYDLIVLSHEHGDHFCIQSLNLLDRKCPVVFHQSCALIPRALVAMGFNNLWPVAPGQTMVFKDLELTFTPSEVVFPEMGVLFSSAHQHFWNCVDTELDDRAFALVGQRASRLDLMFAKYQVLIEEELGVDALGASFPLALYAKNLNAVTQANPRCVVPASCGYRYSVDLWQNHRGFPITEQQFLDDIKIIHPEILCRQLPQGACIDTEDFSIRDQALPWVERLNSDGSGVLDWRPDRGIPDLRDENPQGQNSDTLRRELKVLFEGQFLQQFTDPALQEWRLRLAMGRVVWQLNVVYPDGKIEERWLDFAQYPAAWLTRPPRVPKMLTSICASTVSGLLSGAITPYRALFTRRVVLKLYTPTDGGIDRIGTLADEPIGRILFPTANLRYVDRELARLGYKAFDSPTLSEVEGAIGLRNVRRVRGLSRRL